MQYLPYKDRRMDRSIVVAELTSKCRNPWQSVFCTGVADNLTAERQRWGVKFVAQALQDMPALCLRS